jgi:hypothetical protein
MLSRKCLTRQLSHSRYQSASRQLLNADGILMTLVK